MSNFASIFSEKSSSPLKTIDLFSGCGGLTLGLHRAGHKLIFAVEKDPMAFETFSANFLEPTATYPAGENWPSWLVRQSHDIQALLSDEDSRRQLANLRGKVDLVCGGPPCQGFSVGGLRDGKDVRNQLPHRYIEFVELVRPPFVLLENVEGMARKFVSRPGHMEISFVEWVKLKLGELGYDSEFEILDASDFGVPQVRRRVFLFGVDRTLCTKSGLTAKDFFLSLRRTQDAFRSHLGLPIGRKITVKEAIDDLDGTRQVTCPDSPKFQAGTYKAARSAYAKLMRRGAPTSAVPNSHRFSVHTDRILDFYRTVQSDKVFGRLPKAYLIAHGTKKDKKVLIDPDVPASTITTHPDEFIHFRSPRNITIREMARIRSFPDDFIFKGRYTVNGDRRRHDVPRCSQVGNAVPPVLAEAIGWALHEFQRDLNKTANPLRSASKPNKLRQLVTTKEFQEG
jgi:DNA (cytosine-5)-methyltransferase 1